MRVAVVSHRTPSEDGDGVDRLRRTARLLAEDGHEVTYFCSQFWEGEAYERTDDDVRYLAVTEASSTPRLFAFALAFVLLRYRPDVIYAGYDPPQQVLGSKAAGTVLRSPVVVDWYGENRLPGSGGARKRALSWADRVVVPSRVVETWVRELGCADDKVEIIPESVDLSLVRNLPQFGDADVVYSRRLDEDANLESVLLALAELRERDWEAVVIGDGPARDRYEQQAEELRIDDRVTFVGERPLEDRIARYRGAHVFAQTAFRECFARELLWALAAGCVGVVEYQAESSAHELIEQADRGIRTTNDRELSEAIVQAGDLDPADVNENFAEYDRDAVVERLVACFEQADSELGLF